MNRVSRERHWFPAHQPQTLQIAALLLYWNAFLGLVAGLAVGGAGHLALSPAAGEAAGAFGIANERRWGYVLALAAAVVPLVLVIAVAGYPRSRDTRAALPGRARRAPRPPDEPRLLPALVPLTSNPRPVEDRAPRATSSPDGEALPRGEEKVALVRAMFDRIAPRYDLMNRLISLGLDRAWRKRTVRMLELAPPSDVVDLACGTGDLCRELTAAGHRAVGVDFAANMLAAAKAGPVPLVRADAVALPLATGAADGLVCGFALRNFADLASVLAEVARVVRPGGGIALLEVDEPRSRFSPSATRSGSAGWCPASAPFSPMAPPTVTCRAPSPTSHPGRSSPGSSNVPGSPARDTIRSTAGSPRSSSRPGWAGDPSSRGPVLPLRRGTRRELAGPAHRSRRRDAARRRAQLARRPPRSGRRRTGPTARLPGRARDRARRRRRAVLGARRAPRVSTRFGRTCGRRARPRALVRDSGKTGRRRGVPRPGRARRAPVRHLGVGCTRHPRGHRRRRRRRRLRRRRRAEDETRRARRTARVRPPPARGRRRRRCGTRPVPGRLGPPPRGLPRPGPCST